jgi:hypothetical protein
MPAPCAAHFHLRQGFLSGLARRRGVHRFADFEEAGRRGPVAAPWFDGAAAQQDLALPLRHAADHHTGVLVVHRAAGRAHRARQLVAGGNLDRHGLTAVWTEFHGAGGLASRDSGIVLVLTMASWRNW